MRRQAIGCALVLVSLLAGAASAPAACTKPHHHKVGHGPMPQGEDWSVTAAIRNNGNRCKQWLLDLEFSLGEYGEAGTATGIPAGGHVPPEYFTLSASNYPNLDHSESVFFGYTGREGVTVIAEQENGETFEVKPQLAPERLRAKVNWLRSFRFFVSFVPNVVPIVKASVYTRGGRLIYRAVADEGSFW